MPKLVERATAVLCAVVLRWELGKNIAARALRHVVQIENCDDLLTASGSPLPPLSACHGCCGNDCWCLGNSSALLEASGTALLPLLSGQSTAWPHGTLEPKALVTQLDGTVRPGLRSAYVCIAPSSAAAAQSRCHPRRRLVSARCQSRYPAYFRLDDEPAARADVSHVVLWSTNGLEGVHDRIAQDGDRTPSKTSSEVDVGDCDETPAFDRDCILPCCRPSFSCRCVFKCFRMRL